MGFTKALSLKIFIFIIITGELFSVKGVEKHQYDGYSLIENLSEMLTHFSYDARGLFRKKWQKKPRDNMSEKQQRHFNFRRDVLHSNLRQLVTLFDLCLKEVPHLIPGWLFTSFIDALIMGTYPFERNSLMEIDSYYIKAHQANIPFDIITFNILLKGVRKTEPVICGGLAAAYLNEMHQLKIEPDAYTINELLCMAARHPNSTSYDRIHSNKWVADQEYNYYLSNMLNCQLDPQCSPVVILNSYLNVYAEDGDFDGMKHALNIARKGGMKLERSLENGALHTTLNKCRRNWQKRDNKGLHGFDRISIYDYL